MKKTIDLYTNPSSMEPLFPSDQSGKLDELAIEIIEKAAKLSGTMNPITRSAIADFLRPMNSYYSNLIEGHDTHPIAINRALKQDYSDQKKERNLQLEAYAHINVHKEITNEFIKAKIKPIPSSSNYLKQIHKRFYTHLPDQFKRAKSKEGKLINIVPGEFRTSEVEVGIHIAPYSTNLTKFMNRFEEFYNPVSNSNKSKVKRIISVAASHHRLAWIHPFLDGNGRVMRLYSDACFMYENLGASGLWSISRGLARSNSNYKAKLANADLTRKSDYDGRGNLSNKCLFEFCEFFLETAIDQLDFMYASIDTHTMLKRIEGFVDLLVTKGKAKQEVKPILKTAFLKGKLSKAEAIRLTNTSDKTLKKITDLLIEQGLLSAQKEGIDMMYYVNYSIGSSPSLFPDLYPPSIEIDLINTL